MMRFMNSSNMGTVKAVSPWFGLQTMPFVISELLVSSAATAVMEAALTASVSIGDACAAYQV
jgi:hypothetical protein